MNELAPALVAALSELTGVATNRTANAGSYSYNYASIEDVVKLTRPVLAAHGLVALTPILANGDGLACHVIIVHSSGERMDLGPLPFPHGRDTQATGSAITYHRRYALIAALGMATGEDDDGAAAKPKQREQPAAFNLQGFLEACANKSIDPWDVVGHADIDVDQLTQLQPKHRPLLVESLSQLAGVQTSEPEPAPVSPKAETQ